MSDRFPLVLDTTDNKIKELPSGDNLDLQNSGIVNADNVSVDSITVNSILVDNKSLSTVAFSNDYGDLDNTPTLFSKDYRDLANKPDIPSLTQNLDDILDEEPEDNQALVFDAATGHYKPRDIVLDVDIDISNSNLGDLSNVITVNNVTDRFLKFTAGAWRPAKVQYSEVQDKPTNISFFANDAGYITSKDLQLVDGDLQGSVFSDDSVPLVDGVNGTLPYTPQSQNNWQSPAPSTVYEAIDRLAAALASGATLA